MDNNMESFGSMVAKKAYICIDAYSQNTLIGSVITEGLEIKKRFNEIVGLLNIMEEYFDSFRFPQASTLTRTFSNGENTKQKAEKDDAYMSTQDFSIKEPQGVKGTFAVQIKYRQNATWQGTVNWIEKNKEVPFRSALELIKLLDSALEESDNN